MQNRVAQQNKGKRSQLPKNNQPEHVAASKIGEALGQPFALEKDVAPQGSRVQGAGGSTMATACAACPGAKIKLYRQGEGTSSC